MVATKPPTSDAVTRRTSRRGTKRATLINEGCWGLVNFPCILLSVVVCSVAIFCGSSSAARIPSQSQPHTLVPGIASPPSSLPLSSSSSSSLLKSFPPSIRRSSSSSFVSNKRNQRSASSTSALLLHQAAILRKNASAASVQKNVSTSSAPTTSVVNMVSNVPIGNVNLSNDEKTTAEPVRNVPTPTTKDSDKLGQPLQESNYRILADNSICRSEECFETESIMHPKNIHPLGRRHEKLQTEPTEYWRNSAFEALHKRLLERPVEAVAKNIVFFLGDGMSVPTVTAARILKGQQVDHMKFGEEGELHMDTFPYSGVSKTFCSDAQVADSACSATAYLCGVKANSGTIGLTPDVAKNNCSAQNENAFRLSSILAWAQAAGKSTGVVTTARVTHASPAGTYANIANRNWENDHEVKRDSNNPDICDDIAEQLVFGDPGRNINVILGGGRLQFLPRSKTDPENGRRGLRTDGKNLIEMWKADKYQSRYAYVEGKDELLRVDPSSVDYLLGLFSPSHMEYFHEQEKNDDPSLTEMTAVAIEILSRNPNGFFLFVEGARIDHAHHNNQGLRAIWETVEMDRAIQKADDLTHDENTLILVTADHSHTFSIAGYPIRGNPISGIAEIAMDNLPYTTMNYANGPAYKNVVDSRRYNISNDPLDDLKYKQIPSIPRKSETHGGDDVIILAKGPFSHLFTGVQQQSYIPHALGYAACIGTGPKFCDHVFY